MKESIREKVVHHESGLYVAIIFPIAVAFSLTFVGSRILSHFAPQFYVEWSPGLRVHHFTYGFFILAVTGYLALIFNGPRAKYLIALLFGFGLGLAFDEFGMWLRLKDDDPVRWSYDGFNVIIGVLFLIISARPGVRFLRFLWPFR
ncbi:MAG: hypothetical protein Q7S32_01160 [bacterium]|nr:hypothetical protein [bacterium]